MGQQQIDIEEKIAIATGGLAPEYVKALHSLSNKDNVSLNRNISGRPYNSEYLS